MVAQKPERTAHLCIHRIDGNTQIICDFSISKAALAV